MPSDRKLKVLIVDDHANWRSLLSQLLEAKFDVVVAESYEEARQLLSKQHPAFHVLVADLRLDDRDTTDENGLALAGELKRSGTDTKVIIVTGYASFGSMEKAYRGLQVHGYFLKNPGKGEVFDHRIFAQLVDEAATLVEKHRQRFVFVLMPFADEYQALYESVIKVTVESLGFACKRANDFFESKPIMDDIRAGIHNAIFNIADFSGRNANVFYEVGLAHAAQRPILLITQSIDDVPLSLRNMRHVIYEDEPDATQLKRGLELSIEELGTVESSSASIFHLNEIHEGENSCLVLTAYRNPESRTAYEKVIRPSVDHVNLSCSMIEDVFSTESTLQELAKSICSAAVIISDLSDRDPDVFYLTGLAHGLHKKVILLARNESDIPFDLRERSYLIYSAKTFHDGKASKDKLTALLKKFTNEKPIHKHPRDSLQADQLPTPVDNLDNQARTPGGEDYVLRFEHPSVMAQKEGGVPDCEKLTSKIIELIETDRLADALNEIKSVSSLISDVADLKRQLHTAEEFHRRNLITLDDYSTKRSKIGQTILELAGKICPP